MTTSYSRVSAEIRRISRYKSRVKNYSRSDTSPLPKRPNVSLSSTFVREKWGQLLVLDGAHYIKNHRTSAHVAVSALARSSRRAFSCRERPSMSITTGGMATVSCASSKATRSLPWPDTSIPSPRTWRVASSANAPRKGSLCSAPHNCSTLAFSSRNTTT